MRARVARAGAAGAVVAGGGGRGAERVDVDACEPAPSDPRAPSASRGLMKLRQNVVLLPDPVDDDKFYPRCVSRGPRRAAACV